jgi:NitT/TauT family transport system ATP-binding protein
MQAMASAAPGGIELSGVTKRFGDLLALQDVTLHVPAGGVTGIVGPSGCGKSTLLEIVAGLERPTEGTVAVEGAREPAARLARCALMPQSDLLLPWRDALGNASVALENAGGGRRRARAEAAPLFARLGLDGFERRRTWELSGGMRQRVAFARTLLAGKDVLLLDEPFGALDAITRAELQGWLVDALRAEPRTTVLVTHDVEEALYLCDRVAVLTARPARVLETVDSPAPRSVPRLEVVTSAPFTAARERALEALARGAR